MDLAALTNRLNSLAGFDLTEDEAADLLNEARLELARRSRYPRKRVGMQDPEWPDDLLIPIRVVVDRQEYEPVGAETGLRLQTGDLRLVKPGVWWDDIGPDGRRIQFFPSLPGFEGES